MKRYRTALVDNILSLIGRLSPPTQPLSTNLLPIVWAGVCLTGLLLLVGVALIQRGGYLDTVAYEPTGTQTTTPTPVPVRLQQVLQNNMRLYGAGLDAIFTPSPVPTPTLGIPASYATPVANPPLLSNVQEIICSYSWDCATALGVAYCESTLRPGANENPPYAGLFQIDVELHAWRFEGANPYDPTVNTSVAYSIYSERAWAAWPNC